MKALTIRQPWASLVACGAKQFETRSWNTHYRGPVAIHAAATLARSDRGSCARPDVIQALIDHGPGVTLARHDKPGGGYTLGPDAYWDVPTGVVIAIVTLTQVHPTGTTTHPLTAYERNFGDHTPGRYAWALTNLSPLAEPIPAIGRLGLWEWDMPAGLNEQLRHPIREDTTT